MDSLLDVTAVVSIADLAGTLNLSEDIFAVLFWASLVWTGTFLALFTLVGYRIATHGPQQAWHLKLLRSVALLSSTALLVPTISASSRPLPAPHTWAPPHPPPLHPQACS